MRAVRRGLTTVATLAIALGVVAALVNGPSASARIQERLVSSTGKPFAVAKPEVPGIGNFAEIEPGLARGANPTDEGIEYLRAHRYKTVVAFWSRSGEREKLRRAGIELVELPIKSGLFGSDTPTKAQIAEFLRLAADSARRPLFFHCRRGRDRTGAMTAIYRMEQDGWRRADAIEEMKAFGFHGYYRSLYRFVESYPTAPSRAAR
jgi:tyrosine-protein phosphatase SIW14